MKISPLMELGQRIMRFRNQRGITPNGPAWSREEFAELVGINPNYLYEVEMGEKEMGVLILGSMCKMLGGEPNDLMGGILGCCEEVHRRHDELAKLHSDQCETNGASVNRHHRVASH